MDIARFFDDDEEIYEANSRGWRNEIHATITRHGRTLVSRQISFQPILMILDNAWKRRSPDREHRRAIIDLSKTFFLRPTGEQKALDVTINLPVGITTVGRGTNREEAEKEGQNG